MYSESMLKSRWKKPACRKPAVTSRQYSPSAISGRDTEPSWSSVLPPIPPPVALAPPSSAPSATATLMPIRM